MNNPKEHAQKLNFLYEWLELYIIFKGDELKIGPLLAEITSSSYQDLKFFFTELLKLRKSRHLMDDSLIHVIGNQIIYRNSEWVDLLLKQIKKGTCPSEVCYKEGKTINLPLATVLKNSPYAHQFYEQLVTLILELPFNKLQNILKPKILTEEFKNLFLQKIMLLSEETMLSPKQWLNLIFTIQKFYKKFNFKEDEKLQIKGKILNALEGFPDKINQKLKEHIELFFENLDSSKGIEKISEDIKKIKKPAINRKQAHQVLLNLQEDSKHLTVLFHGTTVETKLPTTLFRKFYGDTSLSIRGVATNPFHRPLNITKSNGQRTYLGLGYIFGREGIEKRVHEAMDYLNALEQKKLLPERISIPGYSRGGIQAILLAQEIYRKYPHIKIDLYLNDPVAGPVDGLKEDDLSIPENVESLIITQSANETRRTVKGINVTDLKFNPLKTVVTAFALPGSHGPQHKEPEANLNEEDIKEPSAAYKTMEYILSQGLKGENQEIKNLPDDIYFKPRTHFGNPSMLYAGHPQAIAQLPEHLKKLHKKLKKRMDDSLENMKKEEDISSEPISLAKELQSLLSSNEINFKKLQHLVILIKKLMQQAPGMMPPNFNLSDYLKDKFSKKLDTPAVWEKINLINDYLNSCNKFHKPIKERAIQKNAFLNLTSHPSAYTYLAQFENQDSNFLDKLFQTLQRNGKNNPYFRQIIKSELRSPNDISLHTDRTINPTTKDFVSSAKKSAYFNFYKFDPNSDAGQDILEALSNLNDQAHDQKIEIKFIVNKLIGPAKKINNCTCDSFSWLQHDEAGQYLTLHGEKKYLNNLNIELKYHKNIGPKSYHMKTIIVDEEKIMVRGGDVWKDTNYKSNQVKTRYETATIISNKVLAKHAAQTFLSRWNKQKPHEQTKFASMLPTKQGIPIILLEKNHHFNLLSTQWPPFKIAAIESIRNATHSIHVITSNINDKDIINELMAAVKRGVKVNIVTGRYHNQKAENLPFAGGTNEANIQLMYQSLSPKYWDLLNVAWGCDPQGNIIPVRALHALHGKMLICDDVVIAGSSPLDNQATHSAETDFVVQSSEVSKKYYEEFSLIFNRGEKVSPPLLNQLKNNLISEIKNQFKGILTQEKGIGLFKKENYDILTLNKKECIEKLILKLQEATTTKEVQDSLQASMQITEQNPLAHRRYCFFNKNDNDITKTGSIDQLQILREKYCEKSISININK